MRFPLLLPAISLSVLAGALGAQNLVTNGNFEGGTTNGLPKSWTFSGYAVTPGVGSFDVTGCGPSNCFNCRPGGQTTPPPYAPYNMEQNVLLIQGLVHEFRADIMAARPNSTVTNADAGTFEVFVDGQSIQRVLFNRITANQVHRTRLCARVVPKSTGFKKLRITFHRRYTTNTNTPVSYIDNIFLGRTQGPSTCFTGERKAGGSLRISTQGNPRDLVAVFVAFTNAKPVSLPGFTGQFELASPFFPLVITTHDAGGRWGTTLTTPASAKGIKIWIQSAQAKPGLIVHLGFGQQLNVY